ANRDAAENGYNHDDNPSAWSANHKADLAVSLAILDALDKPDNATPANAGCGNQVAIPANQKQMAGAYDLLASVLADDRLRVFTGGSGGCAVYLAVELNALVVTNLDCGGRT